MYERLRSAAARNWKTWAQTLADGGSPPAPVELLEAGGLLGIDQPAAALEADANALREVRALEREAASLRERAEAMRAPYGTQAERAQRIAALKAEIRRLEGLRGVHPLQLRAGELLGRVGRLRREHPHAFRPIPEAPKRARRKPEAVS